MGSNSKHKQSYQTSFDNLVSENFIDEKDAKKLTDFLAKNVSSKSEEVQALASNSHLMSNENSSSNTVYEIDNKPPSAELGQQASLLPLDNNTASFQ